MAVCHNREAAEGWTNQDYLPDQTLSEYTRVMCGWNPRNCLSSDWTHVLTLAQKPQLILIGPLEFKF